MADRVKWEYQAVRADGELIAALQPLGEAGWELVTLLPQPDGVAILILKRPKALIEVASALPPALLKVLP